MKITLLIIALGLLILLLIINQSAHLISQDVAMWGGLPWFGWVITVLLIILSGLLFANLAAKRACHFLEQPAPPNLQELQSRIEAARKRREKYDQNGPEYPHPFIIKEDCIACNACVEACPHDVLTMVEKKDREGYVADVSRGDLCMEDTSCEAVCPTSPKACIVINSTAEIKTLPAPTRDQYLMTNVEGCYVIGDVSGVPLIKNAVKEGAEVIRHIARYLTSAPPEPKASLHVVVIGIGPAGLSAVLTAKQENLKFLGLERDRVLATIEGYPKNKYIDFKPESLQAHSSLDMKKAGDRRENILESWINTLKASGVRINKNDGKQPDLDSELINVICENEICTGVRRAEDGDYLIVSTSKGPDQQGGTYLTRRVVLAIGLRGEPMKLGGPGGRMLPGEDMLITRNDKTGKKVRYKLPHPEEFRGQKLIVVGGGNSSIETAVDLVARRNGDEIEFLPADQTNHVTLLVRTNFTKDVKFRNKQQIYKCIDKGRVKLRFKTVIDQIHDTHVIIKDTRTNQKETIENDYIFAMIGGERPDKFLREIKIRITESKK